MTNNAEGIMSQIRSLLAQGLSSGEVIKRGVPPSTVYKVQAQMRRKGQLHDGSQSQPQGDVPLDEGRERSYDLVRLVEENAELRIEAKALRERVAELDVLQAQLDQSRAQVVLLDSQVMELPRLKAQVGSLEQRLVQAAEGKDQVARLAERYQRDGKAARAVQGRVDNELLRVMSQLKDKEEEVVRLLQQRDEQLVIRSGLEQDIAGFKAEEERRKRETCPECGCPWTRHRHSNDLIYGEKRECPFID